MRTDKLNKFAYQISQLLGLLFLCFVSNSGIAAEVQKEFINSTQTYSHVVTVNNGTVRTIYVSGQVGFKGDQIPDSFEEQVDAVFTNMATQLATAGATLADVIKLNGFIVDIDRDKVAQYSEVRSRHFSSESPPPASTLVGVSGLVRPAFLVEVEAVAVIPNE